MKRRTQVSFKEAQSNAIKLTRSLEDSAAALLHRLALLRALPTTTTPYYYCDATATTTTTNVPRALYSVSVPMAGPLRIQAAVDPGRSMQEPQTKETPGPRRRPTSRYPPD